MKTILVTAFEPFGGEEINPTELVLGMLPEYIKGYSICKLLLPVEFGKSADIAIAEYDRLKPAALIMLGQAGGRSAISVERTAQNLMDSSASDNAGQAPDHLLISESGPETLRSTLPIDRIIEALTERGISCEISDDAGTYVCNSLFYSMLAHNIIDKSSEVPTGFIHVPYIKEQGHEDKPFMEISEIKAGIEAIIETTADYVTS